jgi:hypothetical protein
MVADFQQKSMPRTQRKAIDSFFSRRFSAISAVSIPG